MAGASLVALLLASAPAAEPQPTPTRPAGVYYGLGLHAADATGPSGTDLTPWLYPHAGIAADFRGVYLEATTPLLILFPDLIVSAGRFLFAGEDGIVLVRALNGDREPGAITIADGAARLPIPLSDRAGFEAGMYGSFRFWSVLIPEEDARISLQPAALAPSLAVRAGRPGGFVVRGHWYAGNAWTHLADWNPVVGGGARVIAPLRGRFAVELLADASLQRLDLRPYREPITNTPLAGVDWYSFWSAELRLCWYQPHR